MQTATVHWPRLRWLLAPALVALVALVALDSPVAPSEELRVDEPLCRSVPIAPADVRQAYELGTYGPRSLHGRLDIDPRVRACGLGVATWSRMSEPFPDNPVPGAAREGITGRVIYELDISDAEAREVARIVWDAGNAWSAPPGIVITRPTRQPIVELYLLLTPDPASDERVSFGLNPCVGVARQLDALADRLSHRVFGGEKVHVEFHTYRGDCYRYHVRDLRGRDAEIVLSAANRLRSSNNGGH